MRITRSETLAMWISGALEASMESLLVTAASRLLNVFTAVVLIIVILLCSLLAPTAVALPDFTHHPSRREATDGTQGLGSLCQYEGRFYPVGRFQMAEDPCVHCECMPSGELQCSVEMCPNDPECVRYESVPDQCCSDCVQYGCMYNGTGYARGARLPSGPCELCYCPWDGSTLGEPKCTSVQCMPVSCSDAIVPRDKCCPVCPNGHRECWHGDFRIPTGYDLWVDQCQSCYCPDSAQYLTQGRRDAMCYKHTNC